MKVVLRNWRQSSLLSRKQVQIGEKIYILPVMWQNWDRGMQIWQPDRHCAQIIQHGKYISMYL